MIPGMTTTAPRSKGIGMNSLQPVRLCLMLCFMFWPVAATLQEATQDGPPEPADIQKAAMRFLVAYRAGDDSGMKSVAGNRNLDPFLVVHALLRHQLLSSTEKGDCLSAAAALGQRVSGKRTGEKLVELARVWQAFGKEDRARETRLLVRLEQVRAANLARDWKKAATMPATLHSDLERARNSLTAVLVRMAVAPAFRNCGQAKRAEEAWRLAADAAKQLSWSAGQAVARILVNPARARRPGRQRTCALLHISRATGNPDGIWLACRNLGTFEKNQGRYPVAVRYYRQALAMAEREENRYRQGMIRMDLGIVHLRLGKLEAARSFFESAIEDKKAAKDSQGIVFAMGNLGNALQLLGRYEKARETFVKVLEAMESMNNRAGIASTLLNLGMVTMNLARYQEALGYFERARKLKKELGDRIGLAKILINTGLVHIYLGHFIRARDQLENAEATFRKSRIPHLLGNTLGNLGLLYRRSSQYSRALRYYEEAMKWTRNRHVAAKLQASIGEIHNELGRKEAALDHLLRARKKLEEMGDRHAVAIVLLSLGRVQCDFRRYEEALDCFTKAGRLMKEIGCQPGIADALAETASVHVHNDNLALALDCYRRAADCAVHPLALASRLISMGRVLGKLGRDQDAVIQFDRAGTLLEDFGDGQVKVRYFFEKGFLQLGLNQPRKAMATVCRGIDILNRLGHGLSAGGRFGLREKARLASDIGFRSACRILQSNTPDQSRILEDLFRMVEAGRGLLLAEELINREVLCDALLTPALRDAESMSRMRVKAVQKKMLDLSMARPPDPAALARIRETLRVAYHDLEACISRVKREARRVAAVLYPEPVQLKMLQQHLKKEEAFVYFDLPAGEDRASALVVTCEAVTLVPLGAAGPLTDRITRFLRLVSNDLSDERSVLAPGLYDSLLRPIEKVTLGKKHLIISPDGKLAFLPLEALIRTEGDEAVRVIERWEVTYVPSATVHVSLLKWARDLQEGRGVLALGDPVYEELRKGGKSGGKKRDAILRGPGDARRLIESGKEVRGIAELFSRDERIVLLREEASVAGFKNALAGRPGRLAAVHLACHAHIDTFRPRLTGLLLSGREMLTLDDIYKLNIPADLTVLSACSTAQGKFERGEGVLGLVRGIFLAGCPRALVSNWDVDDASTRRFMVAFYTNRFVRGLAPGAALRATKLDMLESGPAPAHPAHWAAFVLWGPGN